MSNNGFDKELEEAIDILKRYSENEDLRKIGDILQKVQEKLPFASVGDTVYVLGEMEIESFIVESVHIEDGSNCSYIDVVHTELGTYARYYEQSFGTIVFSNYNDVMDKFLEV